VTLTYAFDHPHATRPVELKALLGGKGANLAEMSSVLGLPVPPGFTITTEACRSWLAGAWPEGLDDEIDAQLDLLEQRSGRRLGDAGDPLLVSVRSGARWSMPGMMDTVLDLGLSPASVEGLAASTGRRFAFDSYRRFSALFGDVVLGVSRQHFDAALDEAKRAEGVEADADLSASALEALCERSRALVEDATGEAFPDDPRRQLRLAIEAVFRSWTGARAVAYRTREHLPDDAGTAVNVQAMVYGNRDDRSGTGVAFTRDPSTGAQGEYGDFLVSAQGEDVVAGIRHPMPLAELASLFPAAHAELLEHFGRLERHYRDMLDVEFTIEQDRLWMLQVRVGKRTGAAAVRIACDLVDDVTIALTPAEALARVEPGHIDQLLHPQLDAGEAQPLTVGLGASPGAAVGEVVFDADDAVAARDQGRSVVLVRPETSPEDVHGLQASAGVLTTHGGLVSHAAVVARGWGIPAVVGAQALEIGSGSFTVDGTVVHEGDAISLDGATGAVYVGALPVVEATAPEELERVLGWADEVRADHGLGVRANADRAEDATRARELGAEGIGLCRTEHQFFDDRLPLVRRMILATSPEENEAALAALLELQRGDFEELLEVMDGLPVVVRLLDPPLHEFLPGIEEIHAAELAGTADEATHHLFAAARAWHEVNPMLGTRGVRLGILKAGLFQMQARAVVEAAVARHRAGGDPRPEIMVPLIVTRAEMALVRRWIQEEVDRGSEMLGRDLPVPIGCMIETPRAAVRGDDLAEVADFFSFGTNDLTQMTFGFSRDDVEGRLMARYLEDGLLPRNPFETIDHRGVGELVTGCVAKGRAVNPELGLGVCGEHGGDPESIHFFHEAGLDYVSCSPFRVPVARLAAAQARLESGPAGA
jgi:pyruvate,orthophosphate dikinase